MAERVGFEPTCPCGQDAFEAPPLRPLRYLSEAGRAYTEPSVYNGAGVELGREEPLAERQESSWHAPNCRPILRRSLLVRWTLAMLCEASVVRSQRRSSVIALWRWLSRLDVTDFASGGSHARDEKPRPRAVRHSKARQPPASREKRAQRASAGCFSSTARNAASHAGCAGHAGAVTSRPSVSA